MIAVLTDLPHQKIFLEIFCVVCGYLEPHHWGLFVGEFLCVVSSQGLCKIFLLRTKSCFGIAVVLPTRWVTFKLLEELRSSTTKITIHGRRVWNHTCKARIFGKSLVVVKLHNHLTMIPHQRSGKSEQGRPCSPSRPQ